MHDTQCFFWRMVMLIRKHRVVAHTLERAFEREDLAIRDSEPLPHRPLADIRDHRRCFHLAVAREMARLMQESPKLPFVEPAFAGLEQVSIALPNLAPGLELCLSSGTNRPSRAPRRAVLQWVAVALRSADAFSHFAGR